MALRVGDVIATIKADVSNFTKGINDAQSKLQTFNSKLSTVGDASTKAFNIASKGILIGAGALGAFATASVKVAGDMESARQGFVALLGDAEKADKTMQRIKEEAKATPFELAGLVTGAQALTAITKDGDQAVDTLLDVGKAIATSGKGQAELDRVILNLQQIASTGKVTAMDIRQFQGAIPMFNDILEYSGLTTEELQNSADASDLLFEAFKKAGEEGGITAQGFTAQAGTFNQLMSNLKDTLAITGMELVKNTGIFDFFKGAIEGATGWIENLGNKITTVVKLIRAGFSGELGGEFLRSLGLYEDDAIVTKWFNIGRAIQGVFEAIKYDDVGILGQAFEALNIDPVWVDRIGVFAGKLRDFGNWVVENKDTILTFLKGLAIAFGALAVIGGITALLSALTNPITIIMALVALLYTAWTQNWGGIRDKTLAVIDYLTELFYEYKDEFTYIWEGIKAFVEWVGNKIKDFWDVWGNTIIALFKNAMSIIGSVIQNGFNIIIGIVKFVIAVFTGDWSTAWEEIKRIFRAGKDILETIMNALVDILKNIGISILKALTQPFEDAWNKIKEIAEKIKNKMKEISPFHRESPSLVDLVTAGVAEIKSQYASLASDLNIPNVAHAGVPLANGGSVVQNNTFYPSDGLDVETIMDKLTYDYRNAL